jgi:hypothetical protein
MRVRVSLDFDILIESVISLCIIETVGAIFREYKPWIVLLVTQWSKSSKTNDGSDAPKIPSGKGKRLIVLHAGTRSEGLIEGCDLVFLTKSKDGDYSFFYIFSYNTFLVSVVEKGMLCCVR